MRLVFPCRLVKKRCTYAIFTMAFIWLIIGYKKVELNRNLYSSDLPDESVTVRAVRPLKKMFENNSLRCPYTSRPNKRAIDISQGRWQTESSRKGKVYLYSAYYDDRKLAGSRYVRVNLMATSYPGITLYCHFWYDDYPSALEPYVQLGILNETGINRFDFAEGRFFEYMLSCPVHPGQPRPSHVSVTEEEPCKSLRTLLPVGHEAHPEPPLEFGVCVVNGHGSFTPHEMVEWFEFYRLMGVTEFNLYNTSYHGVGAVLKYYVDEKILTLNQIPHPLGPDAQSTYSRSKIRNLRTTCLNDCMLRNMHRYRYLVVVDHDEFIVPRGNLSNFSELIRESVGAIKAKEEVMSVGFRNAYFFKTFPPDLYKPRHLKTIRYRHRTLPLSPYTASKSILKPAFCYNLMNHYCYTPLPLYAGKISYFSPEHLAMSHHYRFCGKFTGTRSCSVMHGDQIPDDTMLKFERPLTANVEKVLTILNVQFH